MEIRKFVCPRCSREVKFDETGRRGVCAGCGASYQLGGAASLAEAENLTPEIPEIPEYTPGRPVLRGQLTPEYRVRAEEKARREREAQLRAAAYVPAATTAAPVAPVAAPVSAPVSALPAAPASVPLSFVSAPVKVRRDYGDRLRQAQRHLRGKQWRRADALLDDIILLDPSCSEAYIGKLMSENHATREEALAGVGEKLTESRYYALAMKTGSDAVRDRLTGYTQGAVQPESAQPESAQPADVQPTEVIQPTAIQPTAIQPTAIQPTAVQPTAQNTAVQPAGVQATDTRSGVPTVIAAPAETAFPEPASDAERAAGKAIADTDRRLVARLSDNADRRVANRKLRHADRALARKKWKKATTLYGEVLAIDPENSYAYLGRMLAGLRLTSEKKIPAGTTDLSNNTDFLLALHYSSGALHKRLSSYANALLAARLERERSQLAADESRNRALEAITDRRVSEIERRMREIEEKNNAAGIPGDVAERDREKKTSAILDHADKKRERRKWKKAEKLYREALSVDGECADAYIGLLLTGLRLTEERKLTRVKTDFGADENFLLAMHYGSRATRRRLERYLATSQGTGTRLPVPVVTGAVVTAAETAAPAASGEVALIREEMNRRLDVIERAVTGQSGSAVTVGTLESRLAAAEREALLIRVKAAEISAVDTKSAALDRAEMQARLAGAEAELIRLRAAAQFGAGAAPALAATPVIPQKATDLEPLFKQAEKKLRHGKWTPAETDFRAILKLDPVSARAYLGLLQCELRLTQEKSLGNYHRSFSDSENFALAFRFADPVMRRRIGGYADKVDRKCGINRTKTESQYVEEERRRNEKELAQKKSAVITAAIRRVESCRVAGTLLKEKVQDERLAVARRYLRRRKYARATAELDDLLSKSPDCCGAYLLRLLCSLDCRSEKELGRLTVDFRSNPDFILAVYFGRKSTGRRLEKYAAKAAKNAEEEDRRALGDWRGLKETELNEEAKKKSQLNLTSGDRAEAQRTAMDLIETRAAVAAVRLPDKTADRKLKRANGYLRRKKWLKADRLFEEVRKNDPANAGAYIGKLLISLELRDERDLAKEKVSFRNNRFYILALCCADEKTKKRLSEACAKADSRAGVKAGEAATVSAVELAEKRQMLADRRLRESEENNRRLEVEIERLKNRRGSESDEYDSALLDEEPGEKTRKSRFSGLIVGGFLIAIILLTVVGVGVAVLFARYGGSVSAMLAALRG